jgi:hypothetical protein
MAEFYYSDADNSCTGRMFVVQLSRDARPSAGRLRGRIEHVRSRDAAHFGSLEELLDFMRFRVGDPVPEGADPCA